MGLLTITTKNIPPALPKLGFIFKLNPLPDDVDPFLVPVINRPDFNILQGRPPGIVQIVNGDLGITEQIASKIYDPIVASLAVPIETKQIVPKNAGGTGKLSVQSNTVTSTTPNVKTTTYGIKAPSANTQIPSVNNPAIAIGNNPNDVSKKFNFPTAGQNLNAAQKAIVNNVVPQDAGLKSFEKMTIQSMLESQKPTLELVQILIQMLAVIEDCIARFLGSAIKIPVIKKWVGIPSKNPTFTKGALSYKDPKSKNASYISKLNRQAINTVNPAYPDTAGFGGIPGGELNEFPDIQDDQLAYYIGYFDEDGAQVLPPNWVINSNKWFGKIFSVPNNVQQVEQLSSDIEQGVVQLRTRYNVQFNQLENEKSKMLASYDRSLKLAASDEERETLNREKEFAIAQYDELQTEATLGIEQQLYSEWFTKNATSQLKNLYQQPFISTVKPVTDRRGEPIDPFQEIPTIQISEDVEIEVPVVEAENQLAKKTVIVDGKIKQVDVIKLDSNKSKVRIVKPKFDLGDKINYFSHKKPDAGLFVKNPTSDNVKKYYIPLNIKKYFLDWDYEIVFDYEVRSIKTGQVLRTEQEIVPVKINFEKDYQIRLIRIINQPLNGAIKGKPIVNDKFFIGQNTTTSTVNGVSVTNVSNFFKSRAQLQLGQVDEKTGTALLKGNNIPRDYKPNDDNNTYSPEVLDLENGLLEGEVYHGLDPRYVDAKRWKTFWLVEAIKKDENDDVWINGKKMKFPGDEDNKDAKNNGSGTKSGGKQWYGLLDKFTVIGKLIGGLLPIITRKFLPLLVKIIQILTNPKKIGELVNLIIQDKLNKFFKMFNKGSTDDARRLNNQNAGNSGAAGKFNFKDTSGNISNVLDGKASTKILIAEVGLIAEKGQVKLANKSQLKNSKLKDQPILKFILNLIKMPFDIMKKIIDFFIGFIKKLLNPLKLLKAIIEFITFKWLIDILNPKRLLGILGKVDDRMLEPDNTLEDDLNKNLNAVDPDTMFTEMQAAMRGGGIGGMVEVFVYHVFKNGQFVREEIEERPIADPNLIAQNENISNPNFDNVDLLDLDINDENLNGIFGDAEHPTQPTPARCGSRTINLNKLIPLPLISNMPKFNKCEAIQIFLKPFEIVVSILRLIQEFINALISIPLSILGLEPHIKFPKLNFADKLQAFLDKLKAKFAQNTVPPIKPLTVPANVQNLTTQQIFL